ncbi:MAG: diguanylate cyclase [Butyrivibrio sp.]|nr:diguanylate cyclase [Butyrivibrio sp.]
MSEKIMDEIVPERIRKLTFPKLLLSLGLAFICFTAIAIIYHPIKAEMMESKDHLIFMSSGWKVSYQKGSLENITLPDLHTGVIPKGQTIRLTNTIPDLKAPQTLCLHSYYCAIRVTVNQKVRYEYKTEDIGSNVFIGDSDQTIPLSAQDSGQEVAIEITPLENMTLSTFDIPLIGSERDILRYKMGSAFSLFSCSCFLIIFGLVGIFISCLVIFIQGQFMRLFLSGVFSLDIGVWLLCYGNYTDMVSQNAIYNSTLEFLSLYLLPLWTTLLFVQIYSDRKRKFFIFLSCVNVFFVSVVLVCHYFIGIHLNTFLVVCHILCAADIILSMFIIMSGFVKKEKLQRFQERVLLAGLIFFMLTGSIDLIWFNLQKYLYFHPGGYHTFLLLPLGAVVFVISLLLNYFYFIMDNMVQQKEKEQLLNIAYVDKLTQISNRTKCERDMKLLNDGNKPYVIISLDLNHLKQINDTYGHTYGDTLISGFARILDKCFGPVGTVGRMGGDEFIVMISGQSRQQVDNRLLAMEALLAKESRKDKRLVFSTSYGCAYSQEHPEMSTIQLYKLADTRMYEMKGRVKKN